MPYEKVGDQEPVCIADEVPFEIPETWEWVRLPEFVNYVFFFLRNLLYLIYTRLSHYLLSVHYLRNWLEQELISPTEYRRLDKVLVKKYGLSDKSIFRPECRRLLER